MGALLNKILYDIGDAICTGKTIQKSIIERKFEKYALFAWIVCDVRIFARVMLDKSTNNGILHLPQTNMWLQITSFEKNKWNVRAFKDVFVAPIGKIRVSSHTDLKMLFTVNKHRYAVVHIAGYKYLLLRQAPYEPTSHVIQVIKSSSLSVRDSACELYSCEMQVVSAIALWCQMYIYRNIINRCALK